MMDRFGTKIIAALAMGGLVMVTDCLPEAVSQTRLPDDPLTLFVDYARFRGDESTLYVEFYYSFSPRSLTYKPENGNLIGGVELTLELFSEGSLSFADRMKVPHTLVDTSSEGMAVNLIAISAVQLPEGDYSARVIGWDSNDESRIDTANRKISIRLIDPGKLVLSDIQLSTNISQGSPESPFYKNTLEVIPNAQGVFGENQICYQYLEVYNLLAEGDDSDITVKTVVWDAARREVFSRIKPRKRTSESGVIVDRLIPGKLHTGTYTLGVALVDTSNTELSTAFKKFFVYNELLGVDSTLMRGGGMSLEKVYASMSEEDLDEEFAHAKYEYSENDEEQYELLSGAEAKSNYLMGFWKRRPPGLRAEYLQRVAFANKEFHILGRKGYITDMGRVYIVYGPADDYDRNPNEPGSRPYEIWYYEQIQGGVLFAFVQRVMNGEYELVHSTHRNELQDDQWWERNAQLGR